MSDFKYKQCIVMRTDLDMSVGKMCVQAAHASLMALQSRPLTSEDFSSVTSWSNEGQKKVVLEAPNEGILYDLKNAADRLGVPAVLVRDMGKTEIDPGTITALGIGPAPEEIMNKITGNLKLLKLKVEKCK